MLERAPFALLALLAVGCAARVPDDGLDAGTPDASLLDASTFDASTPDAGTGDVGVADAGASSLLVAGLSLREQYAIPIPSGHLGEVTISGSLAYIANSWDSFTTIALEPDGSIFATLTRPAQPALIRCTTLAIHDASASLYCGSDEGRAVTAYDLADPESPVLRDAEVLALGEMGVRDLHVVGDHLFLAGFHRGLWVSAIAADGALGAAVATAVTGNVRFVASAGEHLVALSADRGLLVLEGAGEAVRVARALPLEGTPQDLSVRGDRAVVALGSAGAVVIALTEPPSIIARVHPRAVVTGADLDGDLLALTTLTGAYLYDLSVSPPRLAGYSASGARDDRADGVMLGGRFAQGDFVTSDWTFVERFAVERTGHVRELDMPRGLYVPSGAAATISFRNEGDVVFDVSVRAGSTRYAARVGANETVPIAIEASVLAALEAAEGSNTAVYVEGAGSGTIALPIVFRPPLTGPPSERPAAGDPFPEIRVAAPDGVVGIPVADRRSLVVFFARDCAAMWPVLEDATYLGARGELDDGATPFLLTESDIANDGYVARWRLGAADLGHHGYLAPLDVVAFNGSEQVYEARFKMDHLPRAASHPSNYLLDAAGTVVAVETCYRGAFPLW